MGTTQFIIQIPITTTATATFMIITIREITKKVTKKIMVTTITGKNIKLKIKIL